MKSFRILGCMLLSLVVLTIQAQRIGCVHSGDGWGTRAEMYALPEPMDFDPQTTYRQPVVLISFKDRDFSMDDPKGYYDRLFNEKGFNGGYGLGCVADYFRDQSGGRLNLQFDIYGPVKVNKNASGHGANYYGSEITVSFDFMKDPVSVTPIRYSANGGDVPVAYFDYSGRCLPSVPSCPGIYIVRYADGTTRKVIR